VGVLTYTPDPLALAFLSFSPVDAGVPLPLVRASQSGRSPAVLKGSPFARGASRVSSPLACGIHPLRNPTTHQTIDKSALMNSSESTFVVLNYGLMTPGRPMNAAKQQWPVMSPRNSGSAAGCLEPLSEKFKQDVADERGDQSDPKIERGKDICHSPSQTSLLPHA
jgi:hypothetical protein